MRHSLTEYVLYINLRLLSAFLRWIPIRFALYLGRIGGTIFYYLGRRQRDKAYKNLRIALSRSRTATQLKRILKECFKNFFMNLVEIMRTPRIDKDYVDKYMEIEGEENLRQALERHRGVIVLGYHSGNWELCFVVAGILGYHFHILAEEQIKNPLLDEFLNNLRRSKGTNVLKATSSMRELFALLKQNQIIGLVADHGVKKGVAVDFFGRKVLTPVGAIKLALKFDAVLLLAYIRRISGPRHKITIMPEFKLDRQEDLDQSILANLSKINKILEKLIERYPSEYYWPFKRFKYCQDREILVLTDGKIGHLRQTEACLKLIEDIAKEKGLKIKLNQVRVEFKNPLSRNLQALGVGLASRSSCRGCLICLKAFLKEESLSKIESSSPDLVLSCGSSLAGVNFVVSSENQARSVVIMRPGALSMRRFDLVIIPQHDNPPSRENIIVSQGALNSTDEITVKKQASQLQESLGLKLNTGSLAVGLLIGGDSRGFSLSREAVSTVISQVKAIAQVYHLDILATTSRRTSRDIEVLMRDELDGHQRSKLLVIANEKNIPFTVGGILGLSQIVVVSPESISMISEAASSGRYVVVFQQENRLGKRHERFLRQLDQNGYIYLSKASDLKEKLEEILRLRPQIKVLQDGRRVAQRLERLL